MTKAIAVLIATLAFVAGAYLVTFTGFAPEHFPVPQVDPPVQPAGYAFAIWGVIFLWLIASGTFGLLRRADARGWQPVRLPLIFSCAIGAIWNAVANQSPVWATVLIWIMLATALLALFRAPAEDRPWLAWPVGLYAGWLTAASSVSIGLMLAGYGVLAADTATLVAIGLAAALSIGVITLTGNPAFVAAVIWALVALVIKNMAAHPTLAYAAGIAIAVLCVSLVVGPARFRNVH